MKFDRSVEYRLYSYGGTFDIMRPDPDTMSEFSTIRFPCEEESSCDLDTNCRECQTYFLSRPAYLTLYGTIGVVTVVLYLWSPATVGNLIMTGSIILVAICLASILRYRTLSLIMGLTTIVSVSMIYQVLAPFQGNNFLFGNKIIFVLSVVALLIPIGATIGLAVKDATSLGGGERISTLVLILGVLGLGLSIAHELLLFLSKVITESWLTDASAYARRISQVRVQLLLVAVGLTLLYAITVALRIKISVVMVSCHMCSVVCTGCSRILGRYRDFGALCLGLGSTNSRSARPVGSLLRHGHIHFQKLEVFRKRRQI